MKPWTRWIILFCTTFIPLYTHASDKDKKVSPISRVAVLPFRDYTDSGKAEMMAKEFASKMVDTGRFKVRYPEEVVEQLRKNTYDLSKNKGLTKLGNDLGVQAIIIGSIKEFDPYYPPRASIALRMFLISMERVASAEEIWKMAHFGVPKYPWGDKNSFEDLWSRQRVFNAADKRVRMDVKAYAKKNKELDIRAFGWEYYLRSSDAFIEYIAWRMADTLTFEKKDIIDKKKKKRWSNEFEIIQGDGRRGDRRRR